MGAVFRAWDPKLRREVAVKVMLGDEPRARERFRREGLAIARLEHPHIIQVIDVDATPDGRPFLVMELVEGRSLESAVEGDHLTDIEAAAVVEKIARAVAHAHSEGILHRDIKPQNILIEGRSGEPKLLDFGLAKIADLQAEGESLTQAGSMIGTPDYMAPEQLDKDQISELSDVYGLGATLYHALTGSPPFESKDGSPYGLICAIMGDPPVPFEERGADGISRGLTAICRRALSKEPRKRQRSAGAFADELAAELLVDQRSSRAWPAWLPMIGVILPLMIAGAYLIMPRRTELVLRSEYSGVKLRLGTKELGTLIAGKPMRLELPAERCSLVLSRAGADASLELDLSSGGRIERRLNLIGHLVLRAGPKGAKAKITREDGRLIAQEGARRALTLPLRLDLPLGRYRVSLRAPGCHPWTQKLEIVPGETIQPAPKLRSERRFSVHLGSFTYGVPALYDVDGDGTQDILQVTMKEKGPPQVCELQARSGRDGALLWSYRDRPLSRYMTVRVSRLASGQDAIPVSTVLPGSGDSVVWLDVRTGKPRQRLRTPEGSAQGPDYAPVPIAADGSARLGYCFDHFQPNRRHIWRYIQPGLRWGWSITPRQLGMADSIPANTRITGYNRYGRGGRDSLILGYGGSFFCLDLKGRVLWESKSRYAHLRRRSHYLSCDRDRQILLLRSVRRPGERRESTQYEVVGPDGKPWWTSLRAGASHGAVWIDAARRGRSRLAVAYGPSLLKSRAPSRVELLNGETGEIVTRREFKSSVRDLRVFDSKSRCLLLACLSKPYAIVLLDTEHGLKTVWRMKMPRQPRAKVVDLNGDGEPEILVRTMYAGGIMLVEPSLRH